MVTATGKAGWAPAQATVNVTATTAAPPAHHRRPPLPSRLAPNRPQCTDGNQHRGARQEQPHRQASILRRCPLRTDPAFPLPGRVIVNDHEPDTTCPSAEVTR